MSVLNIPKSVTTMGMCVFTDCSGLEIKCERKKPNSLSKKWSKNWLGNNEIQPKVSWGAKK